MSRVRVDPTACGIDFRGSYVEVATWPDGAWIAVPTERWVTRVIRLLDPVRGVSFIRLQFMGFDTTISRGLLVPSSRKDVISNEEYDRWSWFFSFALPNWNDDCFRHATPEPGFLAGDFELYGLLGELHPIWRPGQVFADWVEQVGKSG